MIMNKAAGTRAAVEYLYLHLITGANFSIMSGENSTKELGTVHANQRQIRRLND
jgi:hypothetical protein